MSSTHYEIDLSNKSIQRLIWMRDNWHRLLNVEILNDVMLKREYERINQAIIDHPDYKPDKHGR